MKRIAIGLGVLLALIPFMPGIHIAEKAWMVVEAGTGNWVPHSSSLVSFECTEVSEGGNTTYCFSGRDWTNYYAACDLRAKGCMNGFKVYSRSAAKQCNGFDPHNARTWCDVVR